MPIFNFSRLERANMARSIALACLSLLAVSESALAGNWYQRSLFFLHEDHHIFADDAVGRDSPTGIA